MLTIRSLFVGVVPNRDFSVKVAIIGPYLVLILTKSPWYFLVPHILKCMLQISFPGLETILYMKITSEVSGNVVQWDTKLAHLGGRGRGADPKNVTFSGLDIECSKFYALSHAFDGILIFRPVSRKMADTWGRVGVILGVRFRYLDTLPSTALKNGHFSFS